MPLLRHTIHDRQKLSLAHVGVRERERFPVRYRDLKQERDDAIARAVEAERLSMKSEFERLEREFEEERVRLQAQVSESLRESYHRGFEDGLDELAESLHRALRKRRDLIPLGGNCELCRDPFDKPFVDEGGAKVWRACPNIATHVVKDEKGRSLRICEKHFQEDQHAEKETGT